MAVQTPEELIAQHGRKTPEALAAALGYTVVRHDNGPMLPAVAVFSEFQPASTILLYTNAIADLASSRGESPATLEQWHIAHELYHGLCENTLHQRARETHADLWADELMARLRG
jgi:hypothetical protein